MLQAHLLLFLLSVLAPISIGIESSYWNAFNTASHLALAYLTGLYSSLMVYRTFLHPLNRFPGIYMARYGDIATSLLVAKRLNYRKQLQRLHETHGDFVRVGSNALSVTHPDAPALAFGGSWSKSNFCEIAYPTCSIFSARDRTLHGRLRRIWAPAFSDRTVRAYERRMAPYTDKLLNRIDAAAQRPVDITKWFRFLSWDVMGDLAFSRDFKMLDTGIKDPGVDFLDAGLAVFGLRRKLVPRRSSSELAR